MRNVYLYFIILFYFIGINKIYIFSNFFSVGINNKNGKFSSKLIKKFNLEIFERRIKNKNNILIFKELLNHKKKILIYFNKKANFNIKSILTQIYIYTSTKKEVFEIADYFINNLKIKKNIKQQWKKYIKLLDFKYKLNKYIEYKIFPQLRCVTHKITKYNNFNKKIYYLQISIIE